MLVFSHRPFPTFLITRTTNETFPQSGKQNSLRHILKSSVLKTTLWEEEKILQIFLGNLKCFTVISLNNRFVDHLEKCDLFSDFQYSFRFSRSTADLLTVVSDRIASAFNRSGVTQAILFNISKAFDRVWHASLFSQT